MRADYKQDQVQNRTVHTALFPALTLPQRDFRSRMLQATINSDSRCYCPCQLRPALHPEIFIDIICPTGREKGPSNKDLHLQSSKSLHPEKRNSVVYGNRDRLYEIYTPKRIQFSEMIDNYGKSCRMLD